MLSTFFAVLSLGNCALVPLTRTGLVAHFTGYNFDSSGNGNDATISGDPEPTKDRYSILYMNFESVK